MKVLLLIGYYLLILNSAHADQIVVEGKYQDKNLFVSNPILDDGTFCTIAIYVNGEKLVDVPNSSAYEIKLTEMGFKIGDPVKIIIEHHTGCLPLILSDTFYTPAKN